MLVREANPFEFDTFEAFFGADREGGNPSHTREHFLRLRKELVAHGHDSAWFTLDDDGAIGVALAPEHAIVLGAVSLASARSTLFDAFVELSASWLPAAGPGYKSLMVEAIQGCEPAVATV